MLLSHIGVLRRTAPSSRWSPRWRGSGLPKQPWARATYAMFVEADDESGRPADAVLAVADSADPVDGDDGAAVGGASFAENEGDIDAAAASTPSGSRRRRRRDRRRGNAASLHTQLALLAMQVGDHRTAPEHAGSAGRCCCACTPTTTPSRCVPGMAMGALMLGDVGRVRADPRRDQRHAAGPGVRWSDGRVWRPARSWPSPAATSRAGLAAVRDACRGDAQPSGSRAWRPPGCEPWTLVAEAAALMAHVRHAETPDRGRRSATSWPRTLLDKARSCSDAGRPFLDFPVTGHVLAALGAWLLDSDEPSGHEEPAYGCWRWRDRFSYNRTFPVMAWAPLAERRGQVRPGRLAALLEEYAGRPGRELTGEVADLLAEVGRRLDLPGEAAHRQRGEDRDHDGAAQQRPADLAR